MSEVHSTSTMTLLRVPMHHAFFAAIRARGGRNDNPNARQFRGAYKRLLVRHQVKTGTGNCLLRDNAHILSSTPAAVNVSRRMGVQLVDADVPEDDMIPDLPDVCTLSEYKEAVISYITGFVVKKMKEKITCLPCSQALTTDGAAHSFILLKDRGGLQKPSPGMVSVCLTTEKCIQRTIKKMEVSFPVNVESHRLLSLRFLQIVVRKIFYHISTAICLTQVLK